MKVIVTGSNGLLGQKLLEKMVLRSGYFDPIGFSRGPDRRVEKMGYQYEDVDLTNWKQVEELLNYYKPDAIVHAAAMTKVDECELNPKLCFLHNVDVTRFLVERAKELKAYFVFISTDFVFDGIKGLYSEEDEPNPLSVYGRSKLEAEQLVQSILPQYAILRTILLYGFAPSLSRTNIVLWTKSKLEKGESIRVVTDQFRMPTFVEDLADAVIACLYQRAQGLYHICGLRQYSIYEIAQKVARFWRLNEDLIHPITTKELNQPAPRPPKTGFILLKAQTQLGYQPRDLETAFELIDAQIKKVQNHFKF